MLLLTICLFFATAQAAVDFGPVQVMGQVSSAIVTENSGLGASRFYSGILYGHNDGGDSNRIFAMNPETGEVVAEYTINSAIHSDWEDLAVGPCSSNNDGWCIYIADIGNKYGGGPRTIYKVREPADMESGTLQVDQTLTFTWDEPDAEGLVVDPNGEVYVISKVDGGNGLFAKLPSSAWGANQSVSIPPENTARLGITTTHHDPLGADLSPDGRSMLIKTKENVLYLRFSPAMDYVQELAAGTVQVDNVGTYARRTNGQAVAWNIDGSGFFTLPEGHSPVFNYYDVTITPDEPVG